RDGASRAGSDSPASTAVVDNARIAAAQYWDLNRQSSRRPAKAALESDTGKRRVGYSALQKWAQEMVGRDGIEPPTPKARATPRRRSHYNVPEHVQLLP